MNSGPEYTSWLEWMQINMARLSSWGLNPGRPRTELSIISVKWEGQTHQDISGRKLAKTGSNLTQRLDTRVGFEQMAPNLDKFSS